ncbi:hypothetical protein K9L27_02915 [Candidatus Gracilibacteria bacterium]|nr:hypothetical protein [Candidatus Gracilibacteria bacterium]
MKKHFLIGFVLASTVLLSGCENMPLSTLPLPEAQKKIEEFINANLLSGGAKVTIKEFKEEGDLFKIIADPGNGQSITSYLTRDAKLFFPQAIDIDGFADQKKAQLEAQAAQQAAQLSDIVKKEKSEVELFVMSHCPFGTQIEKGFLPVLNTLGDKIDFQLKFVNYAMHDKKELDEEMSQYCIQKNFPEKLVSYLGCFLKEGKGAECIDEVNLDKEAIDSCVASTDEEYGITKSYEEKTNWKGNFPPFAIYEKENQTYGVQGSPTLVINGKQVQTGRDSQSLLKAVCAGFEEAPEECKTELPTDNPSSGFGFGTSGSDTAAAECGS